MNRIKQTYESITASNTLRARIEATIQRERRKRRTLQSCAGIAACLLLVCVASVNLSPAVAHAVAAVPGFDGVVRVLTFGRYQARDGGYEADVTTPRIEGLLDPELEARLNEQFQENANAVIAAFEKDVKELKEQFGDETVHMGVDSGYMVKTDNDDILALDVYILYTAGSSSTKHTFYTIDKKTGTLLTLPGLFQDGADYVTPISAYIRAEMERLNREEEGMFFLGGEDAVFDGFTQIKPDQNFYINSDGKLVIAFDKYEVAAGAQGSPEFVIPDEVISAIRK